VGVTTALSIRKLKGGQHITVFGLEALHLGIRELGLSLNNGGLTKFWTEDRAKACCEADAQCDQNE
jgi:hypothetical protein